ncbi:hypothetical protein Leryth_017550 [Lithospermum erythrorhizon]|nr:hypothetical protein Leryth_017550 [Lithospermum erythrorhizon]
MSSELILEVFFLCPRQGQPEQKEAPTNIGERQTTKTNNKSKTPNKILQNPKSLPKIKPFIAGRYTTQRKGDEDLSNSALSTFKAREEEIEKKKLEVKERVQAQLGRVEEETKRLALIREFLCEIEEDGNCVSLWLSQPAAQELDVLSDHPMNKEITVLRKKVDTVNKELKPLGQTCQKKEREYKEALDAFNEKNKEKVQLVTKLMELVEESETLRLKKLEELSKSIEAAEMKKEH